MIKKIIKKICKQCCHYKLLKYIGFHVSIFCFFYPLSINTMEFSKQYFDYSRKVVAFVITQKALANATRVIKFIDSTYEFNYDYFKPLQYIKLFKHPLLINCLYNIESTNSLEPIFFLWDGKDLLASQIFLYEYAILVFLIYRDTLAYIAYLIQPTTITKHYILTHLLAQTTELYNKIEHLPLHEIIMIVNLLSEELPSLMEDQAGETSLSWYEWFKNHCLKFSVGIFTLLVKIIIIFKNGPYGASAQEYVSLAHYSYPLAVSPEDILKMIKPKKTVA